MKFASLWSTTGTVNRGTYAIVGVLGFAIKYNLDRAVARFEFHRMWWLANYWEPVFDVSRITELPADEARFLAALVAMALPFIWMGVALTMRRLRSAGLPLGLAALFFLPILNLPFFLFLCLAPENDEKNLPATLSRTTGGTKLWRLAKLVPESSVGSAAISLLISVPLGLGLGWLGATILGTYGWGVFVAIPFTIGFTAAMLYGVRKTRPLHGCILVACLAVLLLGGMLLAVAVEGLVCILMAAPIAFPLAALGGLCGYGVQRRRGFHEDGPVLLSALLLFVPGVQGVEHWIKPASPVYVVRSSIDIHATPEHVWRQVVAFSEIAPPQDWMFRAGIAYPVRAEMIGHGVGAERHCVFSTGAFVEPIQVWDEPRQLKFSVTSNPSPMEEWTPYGPIDTPHLHGYLVSEGGQFLLTPLPGGGTRLEGTTWYQHGLYPAAYWRLWSDVIIHKIHMRVLTHIRDEVEREESSQRQLQ